MLKDVGYAPQMAFAGTFTLLDRPSPFLHSPISFLFCLALPFVGTCAELLTRLIPGI